MHADDSSKWPPSIRPQQRRVEEDDEVTNLQILARLGPTVPLMECVEILSAPSRPESITQAAHQLPMRECV
ncbi:hypothetical protein TKK_0017585 [Trichogramma kaykai]